MKKSTKVQNDVELSSLVAMLRHYRLEQDFTYRELAERMGLAHSGVFNLLNAATPKLNDRTRYRVESFAIRVGLLERQAS